MHELYALKFLWVVSFLELDSSLERNLHLSLLKRMLGNVKKVVFSIIG